MNYTNASGRADANPLPYRLSVESGKGFYFTLNQITSEIVIEGKERLGFLVKNYRQSKQAQSDEFHTSFEENLLDLLMLGVLWNEYQGMWSRWIPIQQLILKELYQIRKTNKPLKDISDRVRAKLASKWLVPKAIQPKALNMKHMKLLILWLSATGDFNEEVLRMKLWIRFLESHQTDVAQSWLNDIVDFAKWFKSAAYSQLHPFTQGVDDFLKLHHQRYLGREDYFLCGRREVEYHLNMVGAQVMNQSLRQSFQHTNKQVLLLPTCMAVNRHCMATQIDGALQCVHCTVSCNISKTVNRMLAIGVDTVLIKHSSNFSKWLKPWANQTHTGLIGTACVLNLLTGGFEMKRLNIPSQCIFIDSCSCKKHWCSSGIPTQIDINQINDLVKKDKNHLIPSMN